MKKLISLLLVLAMLAGLAVPVFAEEPAPYEGKTVILYTGSLRGDASLYPKIKAAKDAYLAKGADVILVDAGNWMQGFAHANASRGLSSCVLMGLAGYDVAAMGLAEFSYTDATTGYPYHKNFTRYYTQAMMQDGTEEITYYADAAKTMERTLAARDPAGFRTVCSDFADVKGVYSFEPFVTVTTKAGLKFCFVTDADPAIPSLLQDGFLTEAEPPIIPEDYDVIITLTNDSTPISEDDTTLRIRAADPDTQVVGALVFENDTLSFGFESVNLDAADTELQAFVDQLLDVDVPVLGTSEVVLDGRDSTNRTGETNLGDLTTDALLWYAQNYVDGWNKELPLVAIQNGGNLDSPLYTGAITETDLLKALPFSPMGVGVIELTGAQLLETLEAGTQNLPCPGFAHVAGMKYTVKDYEEFDAGEACGKFFRADSVNRVEIDEIGGRAFDPEATYAVVADNFLMNGNDTYYVLKEAKEGGAAYVNNGGGVKVRDIFALYLKNVLNGVITENSAEGGRITVRDHPFTDVPDSAYYRDAVVWAIRNGVTTGISATAFGPKNPCTRAQVVTFLWRACGEPKAESRDCPFTDVKEDSFYYEAMLWAVEKGVTTGASPTTFAPDKTCTRAQVVTFLWRAAGKPEAGSRDCPFTDVREDGFYYEAMLWAVEKGVTTGTSASTFSPSAGCTRAQVVTFLWRNAKN